MSRQFTCQAMLEGNRVTVTSIIEGTRGRYFENEHGRDLVAWANSAPRGLAEEIQAAIDALNELEESDREAHEPGGIFGASQSG